MVTLGNVPRRSQLWESAADELRRAILSGKFSVGQHLAETDLAGSMGISRWPVRQALRQLELESLVEVLPNGRTIVAGLSRKHIDDLYDARLCLERHAIELAAPRMTAADSDQLHATLQRMNAESTLRDAARFIQLDFEFHEQFFVIGGNRILSQLWKTIAPQLSTLLEIEIATVIEHYGLVGPQTRAVNDLHGQIVAAMGSGNQMTAVVLLEEHLQRARQILIDELEQRGLIAPERVGELE